MGLHSCWPLDSSRFYSRYLGGQAKSDFSMGDASCSGLVATLIPVIVGAVIGLVGGWVGPWLLEGRKERADKKKRRAEKFEELVTALCEHKYWLETMEQIWVFGRDEKPSIPPFARVHAISRAYFPEFETQIAALERASIEYEKWMFRAAAKRADAEGVPATEGLQEAFGPYLEKFRSLLNELGEFAKTEF
jgi:hypothetical protein